jgi:uncharacterized protein YbbC (DUF1343 family)
LKTIQQAISTEWSGIDICHMPNFLPLLYFSLALLPAACGQGESRPLEEAQSVVISPSSPMQITVGAERINTYVPQLKDLSVGVVANQTSLIAGRHLVDTLLNVGVQVKKVFAPEHGFRGDAGAGETIRNGVDALTGLPVMSLYGSTKKPTKDMLQDLDVLVFDIQDVGARFYTYLSTLHYVMVACAENGKKLFVLDRPNPNGFYIDGPVLQPAFKSFVGMHPIPVVHGCTLGEMALMINGEGWLKDGVQCELQVISCVHYNHTSLYQLPVRPSPNLPNASSIYLYPSLCFFEGTIVSVGRGTDAPFQVIGYPGNTTGTYAFTPRDIAHVAMNPPHKDQLCHGHALSEFGQYHFLSAHQIYLQWLIGMYQGSTKKEMFFSDSAFFDKLAGTDQLRKQIIGNMDEAAIRATWQPGIEKYKVLRKKYLLYADFE